MMGYLSDIDMPRMHAWNRKHFWIVGIFLFSFFTPFSVHAESAAIGVATNAIGTLVVVRGDGIEERLRAKGSLRLFEGDALRTDDKSTALIELDSGIQVGLNRNTNFTIVSRWEKEKGITRILRLRQGMLWVKTSGGPKQLEVETPVAIAAVKGTEFVIESLKNGNSVLRVIEGLVEFGTAFGTCPIRTGTVSNAVQGQKCTKPVLADVTADADWTAALRGTHVAAPTSLPQFWPPPDPSTQQKIPRELFVPENAPAQTWASVARRLEQALTENGYSNPGYYAVPQGFALVSQLERINSDATPAPANVRWKIKVDPVSITTFNLAAYLRALMGKETGYFRVIAFVFTPVPITTSGSGADIKDAESWVSKGGPRLPKALARQTYGEEMIATALVYEFEISRRGELARLSKPAKHNAQQHLQAAKILQALGG